VARNEFGSKIKSVLLLPKDEEVIDTFKPLHYKGIKGARVAKFSFMISLKSAIKEQE